MPTKSKRTIKYRAVRDKIAADIESGKYALGERLPSEKELAENFGVSIITIRQAVELLAREGYVEKVQGSGTFVRHLRTGSQRRIWGLVVPSLLYSWYPPMAGGLQEVASTAGAQVLIFSTDMDERPCESILRAVAMGVEALAILPSMVRPLTAEPLQELARSGYPFVLCTSEVPGVEAPRVLWDSRHDAAIATQHLLDLGHRRVAFFSQPPAPFVEAMFAGYRETLAQAGLSPWPSQGVFSESMKDTDIYRAARDLLALSPRPTAAITTYEVAAHILCQAASDVGLRVPQEFSVVGYGGIRLDREPELHLTTVSVPKEALGEEAGKVLVKLLMGEEVREETLLPGTLSVGRTTGPAPPE